jgi:hypothetical protein
VAGGIAIGTSEFCERLAICVRHIEHVDGPKAQDGSLALVVLILRFSLRAKLHRREDKNSLRAFLNEASEFFPGLESGDVGCVWALRSDEQNVVQRVAVEARHGREVFL